MKLAGVLISFVFVTDCLACYVPPPEQHVPPKELMARTQNIVLAQVTSAELVRDYEVLYTFKRITNLSGATKDTFQLLGYPAIWEGENSNFNHHFDPAFWSDTRGRTPNDTDCQIHPSFSVGGTYLLFLDKPYHVKSFEIIIRTNGDKSTKDKWLQYVENNVRR
jgi:hypothetical protein